MPPQRDVLHKALALSRSAQEPLGMDRHELIVCGNEMVRDFFDGSKLDNSPKAKIFLQNLDRSGIQLTGVRQLFNAGAAKPAMQRKLQITGGDGRCCGFFTSTVFSLNDPAESFFAISED